MGRLIVLLLVLVTSVEAAPGDLRVKLRAPEGELIDSPKPCGKAARDRVWVLLKRSPLIEVVGNTMIVVANEGERPADHVVAARCAPDSAINDCVIGFFDRTPTETISISVDRKAYKKGRRAVRFSVITRAKPEQDLGDACFEQWLGAGQVL